MLTQRYTDTIRGAMTFTGNTLGFSQSPVFTTGINAFLSTNPALSVPGYPSPSTLDWTQNGSTAVLQVPVGSTIEYAELIWGGSSVGVNASGVSVTLPVATLNTPITFIDALGSPHTINFDPVTAEENSSGGQIFYTRSQDVTSIIQAAGIGTYEVDGVPGVLNPSPGNTASAGWTLAVVYSNPSLPYQNLNLYVGNDAIAAAQPPVDITISGFATPASGSINSRVLASAMEGNPNIIGDSLSIGPTTASLTALSGPNNPSNNFFDSTINNDQGLVDTSGSFGNLNQTPGVGTPGARSAWDITNVNGSSAFVNSQQQAVVRLSTVGDTYALSTLGVEVEVQSADIIIVKSTNRQYTNQGEVITYTLDITNNGLVDGDNVIVTDSIPAGATFIIDSVTIDGSPALGEDPQIGINVGTIIPGDTVTITFQVSADSVQTIVNDASSNYSFVSAPGLNPIQGNSLSNQVSTIVTIPFDCEAFGYRVAVPSGGTNSSLTQINLLTGNQTVINPDIGVNVNAIGYNTLDDLIYGMQNGTNNLIVIDSTGNAINLGSVPNLPATGYNIGAIDNAGHLFIKQGASSIYYVIDVDQTSPTFGQLLDPTAGFILDTVPYGTTVNPNLVFADWTFSSDDGTLYGVQNNGTVVRMNPFTGQMTSLTTNGVPGGTGYGSVYSISDGYIYATNNGTGEIYRIEIVGNTATGTLYSSDIPSSQNDGASCLNAILEIDFGDAPDTNPLTQSQGNYRTLLASDGPRHAIINNLTLGTQVTGELDAYQSPDALGDDQVLGVQDDGTILPLTNMAINADSYTITETVLNDTGSPANIYAWIDFNKDGIFQTSEGTTAVVPSSPVPQNVVLTFNVPGATPTTTPLTEGETFVRVRVTTDTLTNTGGINSEDTRSFGPASDGEVEDYRLVIENPEIISNKSVDKQFADLGDTITYTVTLENNGTIPVDDVLFEDPLPSGVIYNDNLTVDTAFIGTDPMSGLTITTINPGQVVTISWEVIVDNTIPTPNPIPNVATVTKPKLTPEDTNTVTTQVNNADLTSPGNFNKAVDKDYADIGDILTYTIDVTNSGNVDANNVVITDPIPNGTSLVPGSINVDAPFTTSLPNVTVNLIDPIAPGDIVTVTFQVIVNQVPNPNPIPNTATVDYTYTVDPSNPDGATDSGNTNTVTTQINNANIVTNKTTSKQFADVGDFITYTVTATNTGNVDANNVVITDPIPNGTSLVPGSIIVNEAFTTNLPNVTVDLTNPIGPGETVILQFTVEVDQVPVPNPIPNTATIDYTYTVDPANPDGVSESIDTNTVNTQVNTADLTSPGNFNKTVDKDYADVGDTLTYTIDITNSGNVDANNVVITDPIPSGTSLVPGSINVDVPFTTIAPDVTINLTNPVGPGETVNLIFQVTVDQIPNPNPIPNTATVDYTYTVDPSNPDGATDSGNTNTVTTEVNNANVNVNKSTNVQYADIGDFITYTLIVTNTGNTDANNVVITDPIPNGTSLVPGSIIVDEAFTTSLPNVTVNLTNPVSPGDIVTIQFTIEVDQIPNPNPISNIATSDYTYTVDPNNPNGVTGTTDSNEVTTQVNNADLTSPGNFNKTVDKDYADVGDILTYTVDVTNTGNVDADNVVITDPIPNGTSLVPGSINVDVPFAIGAPDVLVNLINPIGSGETVTLTFQVIVDQIPNPNPIENTATVDYTYTVDPANPNGASNSGNTNTVETQVNNADLTSPGNFNKTVDKDYADVGDILTYTVDVTNTGNVDADNVVITDPIPNGTSLVPGSINVDVPFTIGVPDVLVNLINPIGPGETVTLTFQVMVDQIPNPNPIPNIATVDYTYTVDPANPNGASNSGNTNTVETQVNNADLTSPGNFNKTVDKDYADVGDILTYTVDVTNTGNVDANNVVITDPIPNGTSLVSGSINVDVPFTVGIPDVTVNLTNPIAPNQTVTLTFQVSVNEVPNPNPIENIATVDYTYTVDPQNPDGATGTGTTDPAITQVNNANLTVVKSADKETATIGETITYTIDITNSGNVDADPVIVTDIIPSGTTYTVGSLLVNGVPNPFDPSDGIDVSPIGAGQTKTIIFEVTVNEDPQPLPLENTAIIDYEYLVDPTQPPKEVTEPSNTVDIDVADVEIEKVSDKEFVAVGDTITYTSTITNTGNTSLENIVFTDTPPIGTTYVDPSVSINGVLYPLLNPNNSIDLGSAVPSIFPLQTGEVITISYKVIVDAIPQDPVIRNVSSAEFEYIDGGEVKTSTKDSNETTSTVREGELELTKSADKSAVEVGDTLTYTIIAKNIGNIQVENVVLTDIIPEGTEFVEGSVIINGQERPEDNPVNGIDLGTINAGESVIVTFTVNILELPPSGEISNTASAIYEVFVNPNGPPITESRESNETITQVEEIIITIIKDCNPKHVVIGDEIEYKFIINNEGTLDVTNIKLFDDLPNGVEFVDGSFVGSTQTIVVEQDLKTGVDIGDLAEGQQREVSFKVTLTKSVCPPAIINKASITYEYELVQGEVLTRTIESNECLVDIISLTFKQSFKDGNLSIPKEKPDIENLLELEVTSKVTNIEVINSPKGLSQEGQILTGKKLLMNIKLCIKVTYVSETEEQTVHSAHFEISTCEYLVIPEYLDEDCCTKPNIFIEDIYYEQINNRDLFYNITYLIDACF